MSSRRGQPHFDNRLPDDDRRLPNIRRAMLRCTLAMWRDRNDSDRRAREFLAMLDAAGVQFKNDDTGYE
jgi:hypothetical protein